ncbi:MAG: nucleoside-diphosphate kinase [bacterium]|nr:nucleoside-diphosphate kinase [bacterium]
MKNHFPYSIAVLKPDAHRDIIGGMIIRDLEEGGLDVIFRKDIVFSEKQAQKIYLKELEGQPNFPGAIKSILGTEKHNFGTILILKSKDGQDALMKAVNIKGKVGQGGIRAKYNLYSREELEAKGFGGDELSNELAKNRLHIPDTDLEAIELIKMLLTEKEKDELRSREPDLCNELDKLSEGREMVFIQKEPKLR